MKPDREGRATSEGEGDIVGELECEIQSREFFAQVGMLIVEGRIPQYSHKGRAEGPHCMSLFQLFSHVCDPGVDSSCQDMLEKKQKMTQLWQNGFPMIITVFVRAPNRDLILLERWTVEGVNEAIVPNGSCISGSVLLQAVRSHIHFSQLSAWFSRSKGSIPCETIYRICEPGEHPPSDHFLKEPDCHVFPLTRLQSDLALRVQVESLPRCEIFNFTDEILESKLTHLDANCVLREKEKVKEISECSSHTTDELIFKSPLKKKTCLKDIETQHLQISKGNNFTARHKMSSVDILKSSSNKSLVEQVLALQTNVKSYKEHLGSQISSQENYRTNLTTIRTITPGIKLLEKQGQLNQHSNINTKLQATSNVESKKRNVDQKRIEGECYQNCSSDVSISKDIASCRHSFLARRHVGTGTIPIFNSRTGLPVSSSPAPLRRSATDLHVDDDSSEVINGYQGRSSNKDFTALISRSAPASASTTQSLLGNFEESVLNGRMEPLGTVEGFTSELGASGSFCPAHVTLPVKAYFFSLSDDNAPSPYLGYISLEESASISSKGYHVPTKGTVQLTLFNPNKTVVKMFVVLYDFSDMPPKAQTFLRQRTFSVWRDTCQSCEVQTTLHYLIHLRFTSSKSGRLYLHTDIRVIFPRHPPDLPSGFKLCTVTDGPTEPRYTLKHELV